MSGDSFKIDVVAEVLATTVSRHAAVRDDGGAWIGGEPIYDDGGHCFEVAAALHPGDTRPAARDLLDLLAARGFGLRREVGSDGNGLAPRLVRLGVALAAASTDPARVQAIAGALVDLAAEMQDRDDAVVPAHLRLVPGALPAGVVALEQRRRA